MRAGYVAGAGLLAGSGSRWVLLDHLPDEDTLARLWRLVLDGPGPTGLAAELDALLDPAGSAVALELAPGRESTVVRGRGSVTVADGAHLLSVGLVEAPEPAGDLPLLDGMVRAASARLTPAPGPSGREPAPPGHPASSPAGTRPLIDGIPADVLASRAAAAPGRRTPAEPEGHTRRRMSPRPGSPDPRPGTAPESGESDHDGLTMRQQDLAGHLQQTTHETVLAAMCPRGHHTPPDAAVCRTCATPVPPQEPMRVPRPVLGSLRLPDGAAITLDRGVVVGRKPEALSGAEPWPHLVRVEGDARYVSRVHLQIELDGWRVLARDLGSSAGTTLRVPGRPPHRIRAHEAYALEPGHVLDLADDYAVAYELPEATTR